VLIFDDGAAFSVDNDYVLGREPQFDPDVADGRARPLTLMDATASISRVHALLRLDGWRTVLEDRGSANGTYLAPSSSSDEWHQVKPGESAALVPGQRIRLGGRTAVFESHVRQR
jgi:pSer/pThr/pTyr-binding forkhead associated (FHA) protein